MLLKFLFLIVLAYWIARTVGNLLRAAQGGGDQRLRGGSNDGVKVGHSSDVRNTPRQDFFEGTQDQGGTANTRSGGPGAPQSLSDVEDAKWTDVP